MALGEFIVVNPKGRPRDRAEGVRVTLDGLEGRTVGFLCNSKPNADLLLGRVEEALGKRYGIIARHYVKTSPSMPAKGELLDDVARECDAVVTASLD